MLLFSVRYSRAGVLNLFTPTSIIVVVFFTSEHRYKYKYVKEHYPISKELASTRLKIPVLEVALPNYVCTSWSPIQFINFLNLSFIFTPRRNLFCFVSVITRMSLQCPLIVLFLDNNFQVFLGFYTVWVLFCGQ
jgi:hypothetical protein